MESATKKKLLDAQRMYQLHTDNVMILQKDLQKLTDSQTQLLAELQTKIAELESPLLKVRQNFELAQREFERAQNIFNEQQKVMKKAQEDFDRSRMQITRTIDSQKRTLEGKIKDKQQELSITQIKMHNAQRDVDTYGAQLQKDEERQKREEATNKDNKGEGFSRRANLR